MAYYRKKPVVVEAVRFDGVTFGEEGMYSVLFDTTDDLPVWLRKALIDEVLFATRYDPEFLFVKTAEGLMEASVGDWIIKGIKGELYPCKPDIFARTYDLVHEQDQVTGVAI